MGISSVTSVPTNTNVPQTTTRGFGDLKSEDFFGLLIAQLQAQDPLKPTDNQQLLEQMSTIRQMELSTSLNQTLSNIGNQQQIGGTSGLIGHYVAGRVTNNAGQSTELRGVVVGVHFEPGGRAILELHNGLQLPADKLEQMTLVENLPPDLRAQIREELGLNDEDDATPRPPQAIGTETTPDGIPANNNQRIKGVSVNLRGLPVMGGLASQTGSARQVA